MQLKLKLTKTLPHYKQNFLFSVEGFIFQCWTIIFLKSEPLLFIVELFDLLLFFYIIIYVLPLGTGGGGRGDFIRLFHVLTHSRKPPLERRPTIDALNIKEAFKISGRVKLPFCILDTVICSNLTFDHQTYSIPRKLKSIFCLLYYFNHYLFIFLISDSCCLWWKTHVFSMSNSLFL